MRVAAAAVFSLWIDEIAEGLLAHGWSRANARATAEAVICLFEGAILLGLAQRSRQSLVVARDAALVLIAAATPETPRTEGRQASADVRAGSNGSPRAAIGHTADEL